MLFVVPGGDAGHLVMVGHGAAVVGAVAQKAAQDFRVAGDEAGAQAGQVGTLGQRMKHHAAAVIMAAQLRAGLQQAGGGALAVNFRITFVGRDHEVVLVRQVDQCLELRAAQGGAGGVARRADKQHLGAQPGAFVDGVEVRLQAGGVGAGQIHRFAAAEQGGAFIDLIEGVGHQHQRAALTVQHRLGEREQRLAGAVHRQHLMVAADLLQLEAPGQPAGDGFAQLRQAGGARVLGEQGGIVAERLLHEIRRRVLRFADGKRHRAFVTGGQVGEQRAQLLERIRMQAFQIGIHGVP